MRDPVSLLTAPVLFAGVFVFCAAGCRDDARDPVPPADETPAAVEPEDEEPTEHDADPEPPPVVAMWEDLLAELEPALVGVEPAVVPFDFDDAARVEVPYPVFLDGAGCVWVEHPDGRTVREVIDALLADERPRPTYVVRETVVFAWWKPVAGRQAVEAITRGESGYTWHHATGSAAVDVADDLLWGEALLASGGVGVAGADGVYFLLPQDRPEAATHLRRYARTPPELRPPADGVVRVAHVPLAGGRYVPRLAHAGRGLIAWRPADPGDVPGPAVAWLDGGTWHLRDDFPDRPVHVVPLADGTFLVVGLDASDHAALTLAGQSSRVDPDTVRELAVKLADADPLVRDDAFSRLQRYGPAAWNTLGQVSGELSPFAQRQVDALVGDGVRLSLGGLMPEPGPVTLEQRLPAGGAVLRFDRGILRPDPTGVSFLERPAYLDVRPGRRIGTLPSMLADELRVVRGTRLAAWGDEWIVVRPGRVPRRWGINHFQDLLGEEGVDAMPAGVDRGGRWWFELPARDGLPVHLCLDPRRPATGPRLPVWVLDVPSAGQAGRDADGWPATRLGGTWRLTQETWQPLSDDEADAFVVPRRPPADGPLAEDAGRVVTWQDGRLAVSGSPVEVPPSEGLIRPRPAAVFVGDALFVFDAPGRVLRVVEQAGSWDVTDTFETGVPDRMPDAAWADPAGRLVAGFGGERIAVFWPDGPVPAEIRRMMPVGGRRPAAPGPVDDV